MTRCLAILCLASTALAQPRVDQHGDPLPEGAIARFGTVRYRIGVDRHILAAALSPDGKTVAVATSEDVRLWDVDTGRPTIRFEPGVSFVHSSPSLCFSPDGEHIVGTGDKQIWVADPRTGKEQFRVEWPGSPSLAFVPNTSRFTVVAPGATAAYTYDAADQRRRSTIEFEFPVDFIGPSGRTCIGSQDGIAIAMDAETGRVRRRFPATTGLEDPKYALTADDRWLCALTSDGCLAVFDAMTGKKVENVGPPTVFSPVFSGGGHYTRLIAASGGPIVSLSQSDVRFHRRDIAARKWLGSIVPMADGPLLVHPDGKRLLVVGDDGILHRYDRRWFDEIDAPEGFDQPAMLVPSPDGRRVAIADAWHAGRVDVFDLTGRSLWSASHRVPTGFPRWSVDRRQLAFAGRHRVTVCDTRTGKVLHSLHTDEDDHILTGLVSFNSTGDRLYAAINNGLAVATFDLTNENAKRVTPIGLQAAADVSPDGRIMSFDNGTPSPALFDLEKGWTRTGFAIPPPPRRGCGGGGVYRDGHWNRFSPDGSYGISWGEDGLAVLWDPTTGEPTGLIHAGSKRPHCFAFSPDGLWLATGDYDGTVAVWEVATGQSIVSWQAHDASIHDVAFVEKGRVISSSTDLTALLWDMRPRKRLKADAWAALSGDDALEAYRAIWAIADNASGPDLLRTKISPAKSADAKKVNQLLAELSADRFAVRETATKKLQAMGRLVEPELQDARIKVTSEEVRTRLDVLLAKFPRERSGIEIVHARAVAAMELAGSNAAKKLLAEWAAGAPGARLTIDAKAALGRLNSGR